MLATITLSASMGTALLFACFVIGCVVGFLAGLSENDQSDE